MKRELSGHSDDDVIASVKQFLEVQDPNSYKKRSIRSITAGQSVNVQGDYNDQSLCKDF